MSKALTLYLPTEKLLACILDPKAPLIEPEAPVVRDELLQRSKAIERVAGEHSQQVAVDVLAELTAMLKSVETLRKQVKEPFKLGGQRIDEAATIYSRPIEEEKDRIKGALGKYACEQERKAREALKKQQEEVARLAEERRLAEEAKRMANNPVEVQQAEAQILAADTKAVEAFTAPVPIVKKAEGSRTLIKWKVEVLDPIALHKVFPNMVEFRPRMREINAAVTQMVETNPDQEPALPGCKLTKTFDVQAA